MKKIFQHVVILGQKIYPVSYIWNPYTDRGDLQEYRLQHTSKGFEPTNAHKEVLYAIAICSNKHLEKTNFSVLIDLSDRI